MLQPMLQLISVLCKELNTMWTKKFSANMAEMEKNNF